MPLFICPGIPPLFAPPSTPDGYHLTLTPGVKMDVADVQAVRGWFHTLRLPQPIAQSIYSEVERMSLNPPAEADIARMNAATMRELTRAWGERTGTMMGHAKRLIDEAGQTHPYLKTALQRGPGSHPAIVRQLAEHAARLYGNPGNKPGPPKGETMDPVTWIYTGTAVIGAVSAMRNKRIKGARLILPKNDGHLNEGLVGSFEVQRAKIV